MMVRRFDASSAECLVFTYKEGLLSPLAHDLKIRVTRFTLDVDEERRAIKARFDAGSLRVVCAMRGGVEAPGTLSAAQRREIESSIAHDVLDAPAFPEIRFSSTSVRDKGDHYLVKGTLVLHGRTRPVPVHARRPGDFYVAEARLHQPDFGIQPYRGFFGTLKVKADVTVQVWLPAHIEPQALEC